jgi:WD40 repeat protein
VLVGHRNNVDNYLHLCLRFISDHVTLQRSPQVWTLIPHRDGSHQLKPASAHLQPFRELTGPGYFAGDQHQMISCVGNGTSLVIVKSQVAEMDLTDGNIHIWDRESGTPVRRIPAQVVRAGRRCVAWSAPQTNSMRFATVGSNELKIWSATQTDPTLPSLPSRLPPISIPRVLPPDSFTRKVTGWDEIAEETVPSPRSAVSVNIFDGPATISDVGAPYHRYSDTEEPPDIKVEAAD